MVVARSIVTVVMMVIIMVVVVRMVVAAVVVVVTMMMTMATVVLLLMMATIMMICRITNGTITVIDEVVQQEIDSHVLDIVVRSPFAKMKVVRTSLSNFVQSLMHVPGGVL